MEKKPKVSSKPKQRVTPTNIQNENTRLVISYQYLCLNNKKYSMDEIGDNRLTIRFYKEFNKKINEYCEIDNFKKKICNDGRYRDRNHIHMIDWTDSKIRENCFPSLPNNLMEQVKNDCWQLGINGTTFRVHGFFIENVFYLVWLDPLHNLYNRK